MTTLKCADWSRASAKHPDSLTARRRLGDGGESRADHSRCASGALRVIKAVMSSVNDVNEETLRTLVDARALAHTVLSLYLDLDPA